MVSCILGLDVGQKKVGVALVCPGTSVAVPVGSFERNAGKAEKEILKIIRRESIELIIAGLPLDESGRETPECERIRSFCRRIEKRGPVRFCYVDEYATTFEAKDRLSHYRGGLQKAKTDGALDAVAASVILQEYIDGKLEARN